MSILWRAGENSEEFRAENTVDDWYSRVGVAGDAVFMRPVRGVTGTRASVRCTKRYEQKQGTPSRSTSNNKADEKTAQASLAS